MISPSSMGVLALDDIPTPLGPASPSDPPVVSVRNGLILIFSPVSAYFTEWRSPEEGSRLTLIFMRGVLGLSCGLWKLTKSPEPSLMLTSAGEFVNDSGFAPKAKLSSATMAAAFTLSPGMLCSTGVLDLLALARSLYIVNDSLGPWPAAGRCLSTFDWDFTRLSGELVITLIFISWLSPEEDRS